MNRASSSLRRSLGLITVGGCLAMVYVTCVNSPVTTAFLNDLGATPFHFGMLSGLPLLLLALQFVGAHIGGKYIRWRKPWFMVLLIGGRLLYLPAAFLPLLFPDADPVFWVLAFIGLSALAGAMNNLATPLWFSWMSDLIPHRILNRYWAEKHRYMTLVWTVAYLGLAVFSYYAHAMTAHAMFALLAVIGVVAGVVDIVLFAWVDEPMNTHTGTRRPMELFLEPLRHREYRTMIVFTCTFAVCAMMAAAFMQIYVLRVLGLPRWQVNLMWSTTALGGAFVARVWGRAADRFGHRPILMLAVSLKPLICLVYVFITARTAFVVLSLVMFFDSMLNCGYFIAVNGFQMKIAPKENRSMFVAAAMAFAGIAGGLSAIGSGCFLRATEGTSFSFAGRQWNMYQVVFLTSFLLRVACIPLARRVKESPSASPRHVLSYLRGVWPMRLLLPAIGVEDADD